MAEASKQAGSLCSLFSLVSLQWEQAYTLPALSLPNQNCFCFYLLSEFLYLVILPAARIVYIDPFHCSSLLSCIYQYWLVTLKFVQKHGNSACWCISGSWFLLTVLPRSTIFPVGVNSGLHWLSGAISFHQAKISSPSSDTIMNFLPLLSPLPALKLASYNPLVFCVCFFQCPPFVSKCRTVVESPCKEVWGNFLWRTLK